MSLHAFEIGQRVKTLSRYRRPFVDGGQRLGKPILVQGGRVGWISSISEDGGITCYEVRFGKNNWISYEYFREDEIKGV